MQRSVMSEGRATLAQQRLRKGDRVLIFTDNRDQAAGAVSSNKERKCDNQLRKMTK